MNSQHRIFRHGIAAVALLAVVGQGESVLGADRGDGDAQAQLNHNRRKWASKRITDYEYTFRWSCFCREEFVRPVRITVRHGVITAVKDAESGRTVDATRVGDYYTVDGLFDYIQKAIDRKPYNIRITYDAKSGFPALGWIDYMQYAADEEMGFSAEDLVIPR